MFFFKCVGAGVDLWQVHQLARQLNHPAVCYDTLGSIYNQQAQARIKACDGRMKKQLARCGTHTHPAVMHHNMHGLSTWRLRCKCTACCG
eukprot:COSAG05_NODE_6296_length_985_cov_1.009029_1_plen_89_part_10